MQEFHDTVSLLFLLLKNCGNRRQKSLHLHEFVNKIAESWRDWLVTYSSVATIEPDIDGVDAILTWNEADLILVCKEEIPVSEAWELDPLFWTRVVMI